MAADMAASGSIRSRWQAAPCTIRSPRLSLPPAGVDFTIVNGKTLVEHGAFTALDVERVVAQHNELARALVSE